MAERERKVLIAMDDSDYSDYAFDWYMKNMRLKNDFVVIVHVFEGKSISHAGHEADLNLVCKMLKEEAGKNNMLMKKLEDKLSETGIKGVVKHAHGKAGEGVISAAHDTQVDVIVCGSRGSGTIRRTFLGSVSDYIVHHSDVPVAVCRLHKHSQHGHHAHHVHIDSPKDVRKVLHHECGK